jgi:hypothetical protein
MMKYDDSKISKTQLAEPNGFQSLRYLQIAGSIRNEIQKRVLLLEHRRMLYESRARLLQEHQELRAKGKTLLADLRRLVAVGCPGRRVRHARQSG